MDDPHKDIDNLIREEIKIRYFKNAKKRVRFFLKSIINTMIFAVLVFCYFQQFEIDSFVEYKNGIQYAIIGLLAALIVASFNDVKTYKFLKREARAMRDMMKPLGMNAVDVVHEMANRKKQG